MGVGGLAAGEASAAAEAARAGLTSAHDGVGFTEWNGPTILVDGFLLRWRKSCNCPLRALLVAYVATHTVALSP